MLYLDIAFPLAHPLALGICNCRLVLSQIYKCKSSVGSPIALGLVHRQLTGLRQVGNYYAAYNLF